MPLAPLHVSGKGLLVGRRGFVVECFVRTRLVELAMELHQGPLCGDGMVAWQSTGGRDRHGGQRNALVLEGGLDQVIEIC